jgi:hypothetical protein
MQRLCVWLPTDTLLYLPVYALADLGILARVARAAQLRQELSLEIMPAPLPGDDNAIKHMLAEAAKADNTAIHIAIADPVAAFLADPAGASVVLLGAFLTHPPFWVLGRDVPPELGNPTHKYVYYDERFATGNFFGRRITAKLDTSSRIPCPMGEEFKYFQQPESFVGQFRVITADITGMVGCMAADPSIKIKEHLVKEYPHFLTTGVLAARPQLKTFGPEIAAFLEAVRSACALFRTAEKPAAALIRQLIERGTEVKPALEGEAAAATIDPETLAGLVAARLFEDNVYSDTLDVEFADWVGAIKARDWGHERGATRLFYKIYEPRLASALTPRWLISTFQDYGRFVQQASLLRSSVVGTSVALIFSQILLMLFRDRTGDASLPRALVALSISSAVLAGGAIVWATLALLSEKRRLLLPIQRLASLDENATRGIVAGIITLILGTVAIWTARPFLGVSFGAEYILFAVSGLVGIGEYAFRLFKQRNA